MINPIKNWFAMRYASKRADKIYLRNKEIGDEMRILIHKQGKLTEQQRERYLEELEEFKKELATLMEKKK